MSQNRLTNISTYTTKYQLITGPHLPHHLPHYIGRELEHRSVPRHPLPGGSVGPYPLDEPVQRHSAGRLQPVVQGVVPGTNRGVTPLDKVEYNGL